MSALRFILGDQLSRSISSLGGIDAEADVVLLAEVHDEATYVRHHQQKIALVFSAMRHFARALENDGLRVDYVRLDDEGNSGSFTGELKRALARHGCRQVIVTEPGEWRVQEMMKDWPEALDIDLEIRPDSRFLCTLGEFEDWADGRKSLRMEFFYREMRRKTGWLMNDGEPEGGSWNYDAQNRKALPKDLEPPRRLRFEPDELTGEVLELVAERFGDHFGDLANFGWPVTRAEALEALDDFIDHALPDFGDYQDAMRTGEDFLFHALLSPSLNLGLLEPREVCEAALRAYEGGRAPPPALRTR